MHILEFDYHLPTELIAQQPALKRDGSRMVVVEKEKNSFYDSNFANLPELLRENDCLVLNDTKVFPARLKGTRAGFFAQVEIFLVRRLENNRDLWEALVKPGRALRVGYEAIFGENELTAKIIESLPNGRRIVEFTSQTPETVDYLIDKLGLTPLPPYIKRESAAEARFDVARYQTVYAEARGAIAAPTAGLHFTPEVLEKIQSKGIKITKITHHVGYGTFQPVRVENITEHLIEAEHAIISSSSSEIINQTKKNGGRVIAIGTTTTRALESAANDLGETQAGQYVTELFIYPGYKFKIIDGLLTNFHLPKSSLLMLVSAFAGHKLVMSAYKHAVEAKYKFYSYGDCMFLY
ncbi:MAG: tRNA preQ1(34) S-adenosylmethionine ribosyltransferase-isomerase QueA [Acidobacteria bacterium]|nr:tRNA preQ1(34) S-adenosylmethionine ribosyltransferase-isomerase QueA [Acidobacteriota bacterium]